MKVTNDYDNKRIYEIKSSRNDSDRNYRNDVTIKDIRIIEMIKIKG